MKVVDIVALKVIKSTVKGMFTLFIYLFQNESWRYSSIKCNKRYC